VRQTDRGSKLLILRVGRDERSSTGLPVAPQMKSAAVATCRRNMMKGHLQHKGDGRVLTREEIIEYDYVVLQHVAMKMRCRHCCGIWTTVLSLHCFVTTLFCHYADTAFSRRLADDWRIEFVDENRRVLDMDVPTARCVASMPVGCRTTSTSTGSIGRSSRSGSNYTPHSDPSGAKCKVLVYPYMHALPPSLVFFMGGD
jgi:hypothetical protein